MLLEIDFPRRRSQPADVKERNQAMASEWGVNSFPTLFLASDRNGEREPVRRAQTLDEFLDGLENQVGRFKAASAVPAAP